MCLANGECGIESDNDADAAAAATTSDANVGKNVDNENGKDSTAPSTVSVNWDLCDGDMDDATLTKRGELFVGDGVGTVCAKLRSAARQEVSLAPSHHPSPLASSLRVTVCATHTPF